MTIEESINGLAAAINNLAASISTNAAISTAAAPGKPAATHAPAAVATPAPGQPTAAAPAAAAPASKDYDFKGELVPAFMQLMNTKGQEAARRVIGHFDPSKERLSEAVTSQSQINEAMAIVQAMLQA